MKVRKVLVTILLVILVGATLVTAFFYHMSAPVRKERKETIALAKKYADLEVPRHFYWYNRDETYYTITGENDDHQDIIVTVPREGNKIRVLNQKDGITRNEALAVVQKKYHPYDIIKLNFGYFDNTPVWEVTVKNKNKTLSYYTLKFSNGKVMNTVKDF